MIGTRAMSYITGVVAEREWHNTFLTTLPLPVFASDKVGTHGLLALHLSGEGYAVRMSRRIIWPWVWF